VSGHDLKRRRVALALGAGAGVMGGWLAPLARAAAAAATAPVSPACGVDIAWADTLRRDLDAMAAQLTQTLKPWPVPARVFTPEEHGLVADASPGGGVATAAIQRAVEACAAAGGGTVRLAKGDYVSGTIVLRSGVMFEVAAGARLLASTNLKDYPEHHAQRRTVQDTNMGMHQSLIFAEGCERIGIGGKGLIDGRGTKANFPGEETVGSTPGRPFIIRIIDCKQVVVRDIHLKDSPCWMQNYLNCEDLLVDGIHVENQANHNNDGLDIDSCRRVIVRNSFINAQDDAMCFKGAGQRLAENILIENCQFYSTCNALKFGTDSQDHFRNVLVRNVTLGGPADDMRAINRRKADGGISWEIVDGGTLERVLVHDARIVRAESPLFLRLGDRGRVRPEQQRPGPGVLRYIVYDRISGDDNGVRGSFFTGVANAQIEHVLLRDVDLAMSASSEAGASPADIPEAPAEYPDPHMFFKVMPAYGLWARHIRGLTLQRVRFRSNGKEARPEVLADACRQ
jgi:hypothetical protein